MQTYELTDDSKATLLLCGIFGSREDRESVKPLSIAEYNKLAKWLADNDMRPGDLLETEVRKLLKQNIMGSIDPQRVENLLIRGAMLAFAVEKWMNKGIWIITRSEKNYPGKLRKHLNRLSPPILYGVGDRSLFDCDGLAVVGSRNVDKRGEDFTRAVGEHCANRGIAIISGGARGVDQISMKSTLDAEGVAIGVMADSLLRTSVSGKYREAILDQRLLLVSSFNPEARFTVGNAMSRNKYIYALSRYGLIISAEYKSGGTWAGATEELKRENPVPLFVRDEENAPKGNYELLKLGTLPFPKPPWEEPLNTILDKAYSEREIRPVQSSIFDE
ncbi:MAG: DNA-processing protein DprA [Candidatus Electryonea clarkiae]|nr:DNA-processing protein DprA [Candidatus Electryonea clarkiae]MDP8286533.1 DNA-processing protein DprA [Candidatus Electryonea clarkiae]